MSTDEILHNLNECQPIFTEDGLWNLAVWVDFSDLSQEEKVEGKRIEKLAQDTKIPVYPNVENLTQISHHTMFVVGHNQGQELGLYKSLYEQGQKLKGRWVILNSCGSNAPQREMRQLRPEIRQLKYQTGTLSVTSHHCLISIRTIRQIFEKFIEVGQSKPSIRPHEAYIEAIVKINELIAERQKE